MADVAIDTAAQNNSWQQGFRTMVNTDKDTIYAFYNDSNWDLHYNKSTDGGATWGTKVSIDTSTDEVFDVWYDQWTTGDTGTKIHITYAARGSGSGWYYRELETSTDTLGTERTIATTSATNNNNNSVSITKSRGGNLFAVYQNGGTTHTIDFYKSSDGITWNHQTNDFFESGGYDFGLLFPANLADNDDIWGVLWDRSANEISLKTWDDSAGTWSETSIATSMLWAGNHKNAGMAGAIKHSNGHLMLVAWNDYDASTADLVGWDITDSGTITAFSTNVLSNSAESGWCHLIYDQQNDDMYVCYMRGSGNIGVTADVYYKKSDDTGATWGTETAYSEASADDVRSPQGPISINDDGGRVGWMFTNDDLNDVFYNKVNSVEIAAASGSTTYTKTFTVDVVLKKEDQTKTFTVDAILQNLDQLKTFTVDAVVQKTDQLKTFTLDTVLQRLDTVKTFTVDAVINALDRTKTFTVDVVTSSPGSSTKTFSIDAVIQVLDQTKTFTVDVILQKIDTVKTFTVDAVLQTLDRTKTFTVDTVLQKLDQAKTFTIDTVLQRLGSTKAFTIDAIIGTASPVAAAITRTVDLFIGRKSKDLLLNRKDHDLNA